MNLRSCSSHVHSIGSYLRMRRQVETGDSIFRRATLGQLHEPPTGICFGTVREGEPTARIPPPKQFLHT